MTTIRLTYDDEPACPHCGSRHVRTAAAVYAGGVQSIDTASRGIGVGLAGGHLVPAIGLGRSRGTATTLEAQRAAPARTKFLGFWKGVGAFVLLWILTQHFAVAFGLTAFLAVVIPVMTAWVAHEANRDYDRRWVCQTCGYIWESL
jgi:hypothetical protein